MFKSKALTALTFAALLVTAAQGQAQTQPDAHHSQTGGATTQTAPTSQQPGMAPPDMMQMMQMMSGMMKMMGGGGQPGQMGMDGMGATEHNEGRIAFLRAELRITDAQSKAWDAFAALLRDNAKKVIAHPLNWR